MKKDELKELVVKHLKKLENEDDTNSDEILQILLKLWTKTLGISSLTPQTSVLEYADSLVFSRFSAKLRRTRGYPPSLQQSLNNPTIAAQACLLSSPAVGDDFPDLFAKHEQGIFLYFGPHCSLKVRLQRRALRSLKLRPRRCERYLHICKSASGACFDFEGMSLRAATLKLFMKNRH